MLDGGVPSVQGTSFATESPDDNVLVDCDVQPGDTLAWMAYRPNLKRHDRTPDRILTFRWGRKETVQGLPVSGDKQRTAPSPLPSPVKSTPFSSVAADEPRIDHVVLYPVHDDQTPPSRHGQHRVVHRGDPDRSDASPRPRRQRP
jgi:hypothetical protein